MAQHSDRSKDSALRAVGRTIVNFQRLEHHLKRAARLGPAQGPVQKIQSDIARRQERAEALTLGQAIHTWMTHFDGTPEQFGGTPDLFDVSIQFSFSLEADADSRDSHAKALISLLEMRNALIHTRLARFDWESPEACEGLVVELGQVNVAIAEQMDYVASILTALGDLHNELAESLSADSAGEELANAIPSSSLEHGR